MDSKYQLPTPLEIKLLKLIPYTEAWDLQKKLQKERIADKIPDTLLLCQHPPVITAGTSAKAEHVLVSHEVLKTRGVEYFEVERGVDVTYHGPGQLVAYPILNLNHKKRDVHWYMRSLEEVIIRVLAHFHISSTRIQGRTGVWTQGLENATNLEQKPCKIASIGVRISRWVTMHGVALNVLDQTEGFRLINPCGFKDIEITSIEQALGRRIDSSLVNQVFIDHFSAIFDCVFDCSILKNSGENNGPR